MLPSWTFPLLFVSFCISLIFVFLIHCFLLLCYLLISSNVGFGKHFGIYVIYYWIQQIFFEFLLSSKNTGRLIGGGLLENLARGHSLYFKHLRFLSSLLLLWTASQYFGRIKCNVYFIYPYYCDTSSFPFLQKKSLQLDLKVCRPCLVIASGHVLLWASLVAQMVKNLPEMQETWVQIPGLLRSPGEGNGCPL